MRDCAILAARSAILYDSHVYGGIVDYECFLTALKKCVVHLSDNNGIIASELFQVLGTCSLKVHY